LDTDSTIRNLCGDYAAGIDRRDTALFLSVFAPDAALVVHRPDLADREPLRLEGHAELASVVAKIRFYARTFHCLGQSRLERAGNRISAETYCVAHHLTQGSGTDVVMYVRYHDQYAPNGRDGWHIEHRDVHVDWVHEMRITDPDARTGVTA
jgi:hypothetical protein